MTINFLSELGLGIKSPLVVPNAPNYRPPCWPPQHDWPVILDSTGQVVSRWGDSVWRLDPWAGKAVTLNFGDGQIKKHVAAIDSANADLLRTIIGWWLYGPNAARGYRGLKIRFDQMRRLFVLCTKEGILASDLSQFPLVADRLPNILQASRAKEFLALLQDLYEQRDALGFTLLDHAGLTRLAAAIPETQRHQTPYIPPRIWNYQITRLRECLDDFLKHQDQIEVCFRFCLAAYKHNSANLKKKTRPKSFNPFQWPKDGANGKLAGQQYYGPFIDTAHRFGIAKLLSRWLGVKNDNIRVQTLSRYLGLVSRAGLGYLLNLSLMRVEEAWYLQTGCLHIEKDPRFGDIYVLRGRTTKTMSDSDAMWVTSPSARVAVEAMTSIANFRAECDLFSVVSHEPVENSKRYLINFMIEPWDTKFNKTNRALRPSIPSYSHVLESFDKLLDPEQLRITPEDYELARLVTPTLPDKFTVGKIWPLSWHQLRRTGAVNMQASGLVSDASLQFQLKHVARAMSLYYGQNYSRVRMEENAKSYYIQTMYETLGKQLQQLTSKRFISPHGEKRKLEIVRLISVKDTKKVVDLAKKGIVAHRPIVLGICASKTPCPYGGISYIAHCGGGDSPGEPKPCADVLYDSEQLDEVEAFRIILDERLTTAALDSPLRASLEAQKRSVENYFHVIRKINPN